MLTINIPNNTGESTPSCLTPVSAHENNTYIFLNTVTIPLYDEFWERCAACARNASDCSGAGEDDSCVASADDVPGCDLIRWYPAESVDAGGSAETEEAAAGGVDSGSTSREATGDDWCAARGTADERKKYWRWR